MNAEEYILGLQQQVEQERQARQSLQQHYASTMFDADNNDNLVKWQLDIKEELARIEHLLRKHIPRRDPQGNEYFEEPTKEQQLFNERGINEILNLLAWYLNKNIILSNFSEEQIDLRMKQLGYELTDFIFNNYEEFGLDTEDKRKHYPMVVMNILNTIEAAYNRALNGGERESLRTARTVTQTEPIGTYPGLQMLQQKKQFSIFRPSTWAR